MKSGNNNSDKHQIQAGLSGPFSIIRMLHNTAVDYSRNKNPLLHMYYDSDLNSPIEATVEKIIADSYYDTMCEHLPNWKPLKKMTRGLGHLIAYAQCRVLDTSKLNYQYFKGLITKEQYYDETARRLVCGTVGIINKGWPLLGGAVKGGVAGILQVMGVDSNTAQNIADKIWLGTTIAKGYIGKIVDTEKLKERAQNIISTGLQMASTALNAVIKVVQNPQKALQEGVRKTRQFVERVAETLHEEVPAFIRKVGETVHTVAQKVKATAKKVWNGIKSLF